MSRSARIAIIGWNSASQYSGGRYHAWMMAEALAHGGHDVTYITNNAPIFARDFEIYPHHRDVKIHLTENFRSGLPHDDFDIVILVPHPHRDPSFSMKVQAFVRTRHAHLATLNFETPNWFNAMAPVPRDARTYLPWKRLCANADMVISSTRESVTFARQYLEGLNGRLMHVDCYPSINSRVADDVRDVKRERRILLFGRFYAEDAHKGATEASRLFCPEMRGYTLVFVVGSVDREPAQFARWQAEAKAHGIELSMLFKLSDREKFYEIKRSRLMLFPSFFEGFGYPPVEAQYCNVPCVAFDLPVLRETSGDALYYAPVGDWDAFRQKIGEALREEAAVSLRERIAPIATFESYVERLDGLIVRLMERPLERMPNPGTTTDVA